MRVFLLLLSAVPSQGVREFLLPTTPIQALYAEALVGSSERGGFLVNPSLAVRKSYPSLHLAHTEWFAGSRKERVDFLYPTTWGTLGLGASGFHVWNLEHRDDPDDDPESFSAYNTDIVLRYARSIGRFSLGAEAGAFLQHIYRYSAVGFHGSLGVSFNKKPFSVGLSLLDLGPHMKLANEATPLPSRVQLGAAWNPSLPFEAQIGTSYAFDGSMNASAGVGGTLFKILHLRVGGGYGTRPRLGAGAWLEFKHLEIGYCAVLRPGIGLSHHIGAAVIFPPSEREDPLMVTMMQTSQMFVENGNRDMLNRDYKHALEQFDLALVWWPDNEEAQAGYNEALAKERERQVSLHLDAARVHREAAEYLDALREYEFVLSLAPDNALALSGRVDMQLELEQIPILVEGELPEDAVNLFRAGVEAFRADRFKEAFTYWQELKELFPYIEEIGPFVNLALERRGEQIDSLLLDAYSARERDALRQALELLEQVLKIDPTETRAHTLREDLTTLIHRRTSDLLVEAIEYFDARRYQLAAESFNKILALEPANPTAQRYLNRIREEERLKREDLEQLNLSATSAYALGDYDTAIRIWEQIIAIDSTFANIQRNLERARRKQTMLRSP